MIDESLQPNRIPTPAEATRVLASFGAPSFEGDVARIYHPKDAPYCFSISSRTLPGMPDTHWDQKISDMKRARLAVVANRAGYFSRLFIPEVYWVDKNNNRAAIEWVNGTNLNHAPPSYLYRGLDEKAEGVLEYLRFLQISHENDTVVVDHKPSSIVGLWDLRNKPKKGWRFGLVDVSRVKPDTGSEPNNARVKWNVELGRGGANNVFGDGLDKTIFSFFRFGRPESEKPGFLIPGAIRKFVRFLPIYDTAEAAADELSEWIRGKPTKLDMTKPQIEEIFESPLVSDRRGNRKFLSAQSNVRDMLSEALSGKSHSDIELSKALNFCEEIKEEQD